MKKISVKKTICIRIIIICCFVIFFTVVYVYFKPYIFLKMHNKDLNAIITEINENKKIEVFKSDPPRYYNGYEPIDDAQISKSLSYAVNTLFKNSNVSYIGWGCPIKGSLCWNQLYIKIHSSERKMDFLVYCPQESNLPEYSDYGPIKCRFVAEDWYYIVIHDINQVKTP